MTTLEVPPISPFSSGDPESPEKPGRTRPRCTEVFEAMQSAATTAGPRIQRFLANVDERRGS